MLGNNYNNPLDHFRTYSYQFILTAASSTEAFRAMIGDGDGKPAPLLTAIHGKKLGEEITVGNSSAYLVIDTRRYSQYSITDIEMEHMFGTGSLSNPTVPSSTMKMKVIDTTGFNFFNFMMDLFRNKLQTTRASAFFLLSILFVGHTDTGETQTVSTCHIPLTLLFMGCEFTHTGSTYDIELMELEGAPQEGKSMEQINYLGNISSISTENRDKTIGGLIDSLEDKLNAQSLEFFLKYFNTEIQNSSGKKAGKLVQYMITAPKDWLAFVPNTAATYVTTEQKFMVDDVEQVNSYTAIGDYQLGFSNTMPITDVIKKILESSTQFTDLTSAENRKNGNAIAFKTSTSITADDATYVVHFDVYPYFMPAINDGDKSIVAGSNTRRVIGNSAFVQNVIEYDYIFTGKNSHISNLRIAYGPESSLGLDNDLQLGGNRAAAVAEVGQKTSSINAASKGSLKTSEANSLIRPGDPVFLPIMSAEQRNNNTSQHTEGWTVDEASTAFKSTQEYSKTMAFLHFVSSINLDLTIRGNPNIIKKYADRNERGGIPPHTAIITSKELKDKSLTTSISGDISKSLKSAKHQYITEFVEPRIKNTISPTSSGDSLLNNIDVNTLPVFVKLNILGPNVDSAGDFFAGEQMFSNKFFFNGPYQILFVKTTFSSGKFEHNLSLMPYDISGDYNTSGDTT